MDRSKAISESWNLNAGLWVRAVREGQIASRRAGTDQAILDTIANRRPKRLLDIGCGEGWLVREARERTGCAAIGFDACAPLIEAARAADPQGRYDVATYEDIVSDIDTLGGGFDCIVSNYGLFEENITPLLQALRQRLTPTGAMVIQTLHPAFHGDKGPAEGAWQTEDFAAFQDPGWAPMPWYARSLAAWRDTLRDAGFRVVQQIEPRPKPSADPLSLILVGTAD